MRLLGNNKTEKKQATLTQSNYFFYQTDCRNFREKKLGKKLVTTKDTLLSFIKVKCYFH